MPNTRRTTPLWPGLLTGPLPRPQVSKCGRACWLLLPLVLTTLAALPLSGQERKGKKYALLVGVRKYIKTEFRNDLKFSEQDVVALARVLEQTGYARVRLLTQTKGAEEPDYLPTADNIRKALKLMLAGRRPGDTVIVAFAGHGVQFKGSDEPYFCPMDARLADKKTLISLAEVYKALEQCEAGTRVLLSDACRNDPRTDFARARPEVDLESVTRPQQRKPPGGVVALFSCSANEKAYECPKLKHGVFFHYVIEGLNGKAANARGIVTVNGLADYAQAEVRDYVEREFSELQKPALVGKSEGSLPLVAQLPAEIALPKTITNSLAMKLVLVPAGKFTMGSPAGETDREPFDKGSEQEHEVEITRPFYMGAYEVTQAQYRKLIGKNLSFFSADGGGKDRVAGMSTDDFPVEMVSWEDAVEFCKRLSALKGERERGRVYGLPTEAEWEYACRGGPVSSRAPFHFKAPSNSLSAGQANFWSDNPYGGGTKGKVLNRNCAVGSYEPNRLGLYDMHGNVWEWCQDWYDKGYYGNSPNQDPKGPYSSPEGRRVLRGGSWYSLGLFCRAAQRNGYEPGHRNYYIGFRVVVRPGARTP